MPKFTMGTNGQAADTGESTPMSDVDSTQVESTAEKLSPTEIEIERMQKVLDALKEEYHYLYAQENSGFDTASDGQAAHFGVEDSEVMDDSDMPAMSAAEVLAAMTAEIAEYREEIFVQKHAMECLSIIRSCKHAPPKNKSPEEFSSEPTAQGTVYTAEPALADFDSAAETCLPVSSTRVDGKPIITCLKDLYEHPQGAPMDTMGDLPWILRYRLKSKDMEQHKWLDHPLVQAERMKRHGWRLRNDTTGEYAALGFQQAEPMQHERDPRLALLKETERAEAALQAAMAASEEPHRLTPQQMQVIAALRDGSSCQEAGEKLALEDSTIEGWQKNPNFAAEISLSMEEKIASLRHKALSLVDQAIGCVEESITADRCPKSALAVLRVIGAMHRQVTQSELNPHVANVEAEQAKADENGLECATFSNAELNGYKSATFGNTITNKNKNGCKSATWRWTSEVERVALADLPNNQRCAAYSLLAGDLIERVAINADATIAEVRHWLREDRHFQSALNNNFRDKVRHFQCRLLALAETSLDIIAAAMAEGKAAIAIRFLRGLALL